MNADNDLDENDTHVEFNEKRILHDYIPSVNEVNDKDGEVYVDVDVENIDNDYIG